MFEKGLSYKIYKEFLKSTISTQTTWLKKWAQDLTDTSPKKIYKWRINIRKDVPRYVSLGKRKLKQQRDSIIHCTAYTLYTLEWPKSDSPTTLNVCKDVE